MYKYESIYVKPNQTKKDQTSSYMCICTNTYKNTAKETKIKCQTVSKDPSGEANGIEDEKKVNWEFIFIHFWLVINMHSKQVNCTGWRQAPSPMSAPNSLLQRWPLITVSHITFKHYSKYIKA